MKTISKLLFNLVLGATALILALSLMLSFNTAPVTAFAYLLFFTTLRFIATFTLTCERILQLFVASVLCMVASFWTLRSSGSFVWDRHDASPCSITWHSALVLLVLLAVPHGASFLASRSIKRLRRPAI